MNIEIKGKDTLERKKTTGKQRLSQNMDILSSSSEFQVQQIKAAKPLSTI